MSKIFEAGKNIAMKVPPHEYEATVAFYRDVIKLVELTPNDEGSTPRFDFGGKILWIDRVEGFSQAEIWLEITSDNPAEAAEHFERNGIVRCDAIEPLPDDFNGFWILGPSNIVHLVSDSDAS
ncbi:MAG: hypothetical protein MI862_16535 [Desulfobacterales bacterium]|nr:hypothetical protein [Desulfobacterales bacterium]